MRDLLGPSEMRPIALDIVSRAQLDCERMLATKYARRDRYESNRDFNVDLETWIKFDFLRRELRAEVDLNSFLIRRNSDQKVYRPRFAADFCGVGAVAAIKN